MLFAKTASCRFLPTTRGFEATLGTVTVHLALNPGKLAMAFMSAKNQFVFVPAMLLLVTGCIQLTLAWTDLTPDRPVATPAVLGSFEGAGEVTSITSWREERVPQLRDAFQAHVYGYLPDFSSASVIDRRVVADRFLDGRAVLEELTIEALAQFGDAPPAKATFRLLLATPSKQPGPLPVILMETFCRNHTTIPHPDVSRPATGGGCDGDGVINMAMTYIFGRYIATPPLEEMVDRGFALATFYPGDYVPDNSGAGIAALKQLSAGHQDDATRWGAIAAWGWGFSRVIDVLEMDNRFDPNGMVLYGHSRYGKSALLSAAFDGRVDGVISHQSGAGGGSLSRNKAGETVGAITSSYPHWFSTQYAEYSERESDLPVDQHQLLAMIAPRPVLLGNARRDVWSDPEGSFMAALGADPAYELLGAGGLAQLTLKDFLPSAELVFHIRPGTHGVTEDDWPAFFEFLEAHFGRQQFTATSDQTP